jgi:glutamate-1-semialdehyde 2,1-aminomutase
MSDWNTARSAELAERLRRVLPGGDTRTVTFYMPYPVALSHGMGATVYDVDGNAYVDLLNNYTSLIHGHAAPQIVRALVEQAPRGTAFPAPHALQAELAERLTTRVSSVDQIRFTNSGTESVLLALRAARAITGRSAIVKADGGYHGSWEQVPMTFDPDAPPPGTPPEVIRLIHTVDYNDIGQLEAVMAAHGDEVAALIFEPVLGEGVIAGDPAFFAAARRLADRHGALLICDEVVSFRLREGGYQSELGVTPDLTTFGKIIGGGLPVGAVGGTAEIMGQFDPRRASHLMHAGTFNGNPMTMAAGCVSLDLLPAEEIDRINGLGERLANGLRETLGADGTATEITQCGSLIHLHLEPKSTPVRNFRDGDVHSDSLARLHRALLEEGIFAAPRGTLNISTALDEAAIDRVVDAFGRGAVRADELVSKSAV